MLDVLIRLLINIVLFTLRILCYTVSLRFLYGEIKLRTTYVRMLDTLSPIYGFRKFHLCMYGYTEFSVSFFV